MTFVAAGATLVLGIMAGTARDRRRVRAALKLTASTGFLITALAAGALDSPYGRWILAALVFGWIGDAALLSGRTTWFLVGLGSFLLAHLGFVVAMTSFRLEASGAAVALIAMVIFGVFVLRWLLPNVPPAMKPPVVAYVGAITAMVVASAGAAAGLGPVEVLPAAILFTVSDLFVARDRFVSPGPENARYGLPIYYAAQVVFALSVGVV